MAISYSQASRTLVQATFGPREADINALISAGSIENWINQQSVITPSSWQDTFEAQKAFAPNDQKNWSDIHADAGWFYLTIEKPDHLRQRITFILTQLFVVSKQTPGLGANQRQKDFCKLFDDLSKSAFGSFRELLKIISISPLMGRYLTFLNNDFRAETAPDENYARELLQLFTIGPEQLKDNGETYYDSNGRPLQSYTQQDIEELARVFTGWRLDSELHWDRPMKPTAAHDTGEKNVLGHYLPADVGAEDEMDHVLDILATHSNTAVFISRFFIQKMVTSNPTPAYIERVATQFRDSNGNMKTLVTAILADQEAVYGSPDGGLMRDPMITAIHAMRALDLKRVGSGWTSNFGGSTIRKPFYAPSVFYYYQPDEAPTDSRFDGLNAPEYKLYNWLDLYDYFKHADELLLKAPNEGNHYLGAEELFQHYTNFADQQLLDRLNHRLFAGTMNSNVQAAVLHYLSSISTRPNGQYDGLKQLIKQLLLSPQFLTQG